jgi:hypothetical protein
MLSQQALTDFKEIYAEEFGEEISEEYALELAVKLLGLIDELYRPVKAAWDSDL